MPIFLLNNLKILGINLCKGFIVNNGLYFNDILYKINENNEIVGKNEITGKFNLNRFFGINRDLILFRQNTINKNEINGNINVYFNGENISNKLINQGDVWKINRIYFPRFYGCQTIKIIFKENLSSLNKFFEDCLYEEIDLSNFNINLVNDISYMFRGCVELKYLNLRNIDSTKVTNMKSMFHECLNLKIIDGLNAINTNNVNDMSTMFHLCISLEVLDLSGFDTSKVISMEGMFSSCISL